MFHGRLMFTCVDPTRCSSGRTCLSLHQRRRNSQVVQFINEIQQPPASGLAAMCMRVFPAFPQAVLANPGVVPPSSWFATRHVHRWEIPRHSFVQNVLFFPVEFSTSVTMLGWQKLWVPTEGTQSDSFHQLRCAVACWLIQVVRFPSARQVKRAMHSVFGF